jgi:hypothetical protein
LAGSSKCFKKFEIFDHLAEIWRVGVGLKAILRLLIAIKCSVLVFECIKKTVYSKPLK